MHRKKTDWTLDSGCDFFFFFRRTTVEPDYRSELLDLKPSSTGLPARAHPLTEPKETQESLPGYNNCVFLLKGPVCKI